ncbi:hypothetical protein R5R35_001082 [Gryllus longicercus]|uniref:PHD-type domain-containing protein n=1 Tax=Gryllus longicercus TaxID=2509291 RepID=A0AAN9W341_9ORTH
MASICAVCEKSSEVGGRIYNCDSCRRPLHADCIGLTATEIKALDLRQRVLKLFCLDCEKGLACLPEVLCKLNNLTDTVNKIDKFIFGNEDSTASLFKSEIVNEINDRVLRKNNVIFYNAKESDSELPEERKNFDLKIVMKSLSKICTVSETDIVKVLRLGKIKSDGKPRPIKIIFNDHGLALKILKDKHKCEKPYAINGDLTLQQRDQLKALREELDILNKDEELKTIKFINGSPKIVNKRDYEKGKENENVKKDQLKNRRKN